MGKIHTDVMWEAVICCDNTFDGLFYYGVKSTKICCKPSCKSRTPLRANVVFFPDVPSALSEGYRPCKRCRPDLGQTTEQEIVQSIKQVIDRDRRYGLTLDQLAIEVGVSKYHLQRVFKSMTGQSPLEYMTTLRMAEAKRLLTTTNTPVTEIAYLLGYKSSAHFSNVFRQQTACTPSHYRIRG